MNFILDNNVLISAAIFKDSVPDSAFNKAYKEGLILSSPSTLEELEEVLMREKFDRYIDLETRLEFLINFHNSSKNVKTDEKIRVCRDPKDDMYLELAIAGNAALIITGDSDLLDLHPFRGIDIITPKEFIQRD